MTPRPATESGVGPASNLGARWQYLHPWGLVRGLGTFMSGVAFFAVFWNSGDGLGPFDTAEILISAALFIVAVLRHLRHRFILTADTLVLCSGLIIRNKQSIEREKIQNATKTTPRFHRLLGITRLKISESSGRSSISLDPVGNDVADALLESLRPRHPRIVDERPVAAVNSAEASAGQDICVVPWWRIALTRFSTANYLAVLLLPLGMLDRRVFLVVVGFLGLSVLVSTSATIANANFRIRSEGGRVRTTAGPLTEIEQVIRSEHLQWIEARRWWIHRLLDLEVVSFSTAESTNHVEDQLAPAWPLGRWPDLAGLMITPLAADESALRPISPRTVGRFRTVGAGATGLVLAAAVLWPPFLVVAVAVAAGGIWWYPRQRLRRIGIGLVDNQLITRTGILVERVHVTTLERLETVMVRQSPDQRRWRLASLQFSGIGSGSVVTVPDLEPSVARALAHDLAIAADRGVSGASSGDPVNEGRSAVRDHDELGQPDGDEQPLPTRTLIVWRTEAAVGAVLLMALLTVPSIAATLWFENWPTVPLLGIATTGLGALLFLVVVIPRYHRAWRWRVSERCVAVEHGIVHRQRMIVRRETIQSVRVSSGPIERRCGLQALTVHTAGHDTPDLTIPYLDQRTIGRLERELGRSSPFA